LAAAVVAYACIYFAGTAAQRSVEQSEKPALAWLQQEYQLTDAQLARVRELHAAYQPRCMEMCRKIDEKNAQLHNLLAATNDLTPDIKQALADAAQLRLECQTAMLEHFYEVARAMPPDQGRRYLAWVHHETLMPGQMPPIHPLSTSSPHRP
jgi:hypothetical protein